MAELADAQDLKSCEAYPSYRFDSGLRHQVNLGKKKVDGLKVIHRGVEQMEARRAHNPKVTGSNPVSATNFMAA